MNKVNALRDRLATATAPVRIIGLLIGVLLSWLPLALPCYRWIPDANLVSIVTLITLYSEFLIALHLWGRWIDQRDRIWQAYGFKRPSHWFAELGLGVIMASSCLWGLFLCEGSWGWLTWQQPSSIPLLSKIVAEGLLVGLGIGLAEELVFRGWLYSELRRDYSPQNCLWVTSFVFASLHFIRPLPEILQTLPQFGGLFVLGVLLIWARWATQNRLGLPIGIHAGLVSSYYWINVGNLIEYTQQVPDWVTGLQGNPLAGLAGTATLGILALMVRSFPKKRAIATRDA